MIWNGELSIFDVPRRNGGQKVLRVRGQQETLLPQLVHARLVENAQSPAQARQVHNRRVAALEPLRPRRGHELVVHQEPRRLVVPVPPLQPDAVLVVAVLFVDERACDGPRARVHVLVRAPAGEVDVPFMQFEFDVARRVGEVPADGETVLVGMRCDGGDVEELARVVLDTGEKDECDFVRVVSDEFADMLGRHEIALVRFYCQHGFFGVQTVPLNLRFDGVPITWKRAPFAQDLVFLLRRLVERRHHQVQINSKCVHRHNLGGRCTDNVRHLLRTLRRKVLVRGKRRILKVGEVAAHSDRTPSLQVRVQVLPDGFGLQAERITAEVDALVVGAGCFWRPSLRRL